MVSNLGRLHDGAPFPFRYKGACSSSTASSRSHALPQETILNDPKVKDAARRRRAERESALTLEQRVALNAQQKERAAELQRQQARSLSDIYKP